MTQFLVLCICFLLRLIVSIFHAVRILIVNSAREFVFHKKRSTNVFWQLSLITLHQTLILAPSQTLYPTCLPHVRYLMVSDKNWIILWGIQIIAKIRFMLSMLIRLQLFQSDEKIRVMSWSQLGSLPGWNYIGARLLTPLACFELTKGVCGVSPSVD